MSRSLAEINYDCHQTSMKITLVYINIFSSTMHILRHFLAFDKHIDLASILKANNHIIFSL